MLSPTQIKKLVDTLFIKKGVYPEKYISNISDKNLNLQVLRGLSNLIEGKNSSGNIHDIIRSGYYKEFPDYYKASTEKLLGIEPTFNIRALVRGDADLSDLTTEQALYILDNIDYNKLDVDNYTFRDLLNSRIHLKRDIKKYDADSNNAIINIALGLRGNDKKLVQRNTNMVRKSMYDLFKEIAELRNPKGVTVYRQPNYIITNPIRKNSGILSFTNNPEKLANISETFNKVYKYNLEPSELVADFSNTPLGYSWENEVQALIDVNRKPNKYMKNYFTKNYFNKN